MAAMQGTAACSATDERFPSDGETIMSATMTFPILLEGESDAFALGMTGTMDARAEGCEYGTAAQQANHLGDDSSGYMVAVE